MKMLSPYLKARGFTLTEVLIALLVLGLAMTALQLRMSQYLDDAAYLREKTVALWVANNQLELLRLSARLGAAPPTQAATGSVTMAGSTWYWYLEPQLVSVTDNNSSIVPVRIQISPLNAQAAHSSPVVSLTGVTDAAFSL